MTETLPDLVRAAAGRPEVVGAVRALYARLGERIAERKPVCVASGRCCRFEAFGHRLYVTTVELAAFVAERAGSAAVGGSAAGGGLAAAPDPSTVRRLNARFEPWDGTGCPFQVGRLCGVHEIKPMGCRLFFCDETSTAWQQAQYEAFHGELKGLHEALGVPYRYVEWRAALREVFDGEF